MNKPTLFLAFLLMPFLMFAQTKITRSLPPFEKIGISGGFDQVILKAGDAESVFIESQGIDPEKIITEVKDGKLHLKTKNGSWGKFNATITVTYRNLISVANSGSTDIEVASVIKGNEFKLASSGSGNFRGEFDVNDLEIAISGSSDMTLKGRASEQEIAISGSGDVDASNLSGDKAKVAISGSGDVKLNVKGQVKTAVSGSGKVENH